MIDRKKRKVKVRDSVNVSSGTLQAIHIEQREGKMVTTGGVDTVIYVLGINPDTKKREKR